MPISVSCPYCAAKLKAPDERSGRRAKCMKCGEKFKVPGPSPKADSSGDLAPILTEEAFDFRPGLPSPSSNGASSGKYRPTRVGNPGVKLALAAVLVGGFVLAAVGAYVVWIRYGRSSGLGRTAEIRADVKPADSSKNPEPSKKSNGTDKDEKVDKGIPLNLNPEEAAGKQGRKSPGPALPAAPAGETLVAGVEASFVLPVPAEKFHTLLVSRAGSMGVVIQRSFEGFAGKGAVDTVERFAIPSGITAGKREIPADGVSKARVAALAPDGSRVVVEGPPGTLAVWHLDKEADKSPESTVVPFAPAAGKAVPVVACYYPRDDRIVAVGPHGQLTVYDPIKKEKNVETGPVLERPSGEMLSTGTSLALTGDGRMLVMVLGGSVYEVAVNSGKVISTAAAVPKGASVRAVATDPAGARVLLALTDDSGPRVALFPLGADRAKVALYLPDGMGDPATARWVGDHSVLLNGTKGDGFAVFDAEVGRWVAYVRTPLTASSYVQSTDRIYHLVPVAEGKTRLVAVEWPFNDYFKDRDIAVSTHSLTAYVLTAEGLKK